MAAGKWRRGRPVDIEKTMTEDMTKEWVEQSLDYGETQSLVSSQPIDRASVELLELKNMRDSLQGELRDKDQSIALWKRQESEYQHQITELTRRMDEMSKMIRHRDLEIEKSKMREAKYKQELEVWATKPRAGRSRIPEHKTQYPQPAHSKSTPAVKLPTIVKHVGESDEVGAKPGKRKDRNHVLSVSPTDEFHADGKVKKIRTDSSFGPRNVQPCFICEKWVSKTGGKIILPNINLIIPPKAVDSGPLLITATELQRRNLLKEKLTATGLNKYIQPCVAMVLQPHGYEFMRPVKIELKNIRLGSEKILVFHKDVNHHRRTTWMDITSECAPKNTKDGLILTTRQFCVLETVKLLLPAVTLPAQVSAANAGLIAGQNLQSLSISTHVLSVLHDRITNCEFHVFHDKMEDCISVICLKTTDSSTDNPRDLLNLTDLRDRKAHLVPLGTSHSSFQICDKERLFCYFEKKTKFECSFVFRLDEAESKGQLIMIPLSTNNPGKIPRKLSIRRKVADFVEDTEITWLRLVYPPAGGTSLSDSVILDNVLAKMRKKILVNVDVRFLLDMMRTEKVFTIQEQDQINQEKTRQARAKVFLDMLSNKGKRGMIVFCSALKDDYRQLADEIQDLMKEDGGEDVESDSASSAPAVLKPGNKSGSQSDNNSGIKSGSKSGNHSENSVNKSWQSSVKAINNREKKALKT